ncbi:hypothetical protein CAI21_19885 [Alkalilimnicola ehrlichii]|nr:hypothetical protein CAI21_19885 [Alkalilimnicola ehrlichii]
MVDRIRRQETPFWRFLYRMAKTVRGFTVPRMAWLGYLFDAERTVRHQSWRWLVNQYYIHILAARCTRLGKHVALDGDVPLIFGDGEIDIGNHVFIGNRQTWVVGLKVYDRPKLIIGDYTVVNYGTLISVAQSVTIGRYCRLAGELKIFDNNSHPTDYLARAITAGV